MFDLFRSSSTRRACGYGKSRQRVVIDQYFSAGTPGYKTYFRRSDLLRSRLDGSSRQLPSFQPGRSKSYKFSLHDTSLRTRRLPLGQGEEIVGRIYFFPLCTVNREIISMV